MPRNENRKKIFIEPGQRFNHWTVVEFAEKRNNCEYYKFRCVCGVEKILSKHEVVGGRSKSCRCNGFGSGEKFLGQKFGKLTAVAEAGKDGTAPLYKFECECGNYKVLRKSSVTSGNIKSCGCAYQDKAKNNREEYDKKFINQKFNSITITSFSHKNSGKNYIYNYICDCGNKGQIVAHQIGKTISCGCKANDWHLTRHGEISGRFFYRFKHNALSRKLTFDITIEQVWNLYLHQKEKCALSGLPIFFDNRYEDSSCTASIDRIDSALGYTLDNIQIVHKDCNLIKFTASNQELFEWCKYIVTNTNLINDQYQNVKSRQFNFLIAGTHRRSWHINDQYDLNSEKLLELYLNQKGLCAISKVPINFNQPYKKFKNTISIDRIDSKGFYCMNNVQLVHPQINVMKWDFSKDYFIDICQKIYNYRKASA